MKRLDAVFGEVAASADGSVVVGTGDWSHGTGSVRRASRWTEGGRQQLGSLRARDNAWSLASDVSADGSVIVGYGRGVGASVWTATTGYRRVARIHSDAGLDLSGWSLSTATGVSTDGTVIVGAGTNPDGNIEAWRAVLPPLESLITIDGTTQPGAGWIEVSGPGVLAPGSDANAGFLIGTAGGDRQSVTRNQQALWAGIIVQGNGCRIERNRIRTLRARKHGETGPEALELGSTCSPRET